MYKSFLVLLFFSAPILVFAQYEYAPSDEFPYGRVNPEAPAEVADYEKLIGLNECISTSRNQDGSWAEDELILWEFKYIMNGYGVQDGTLKPNGSHSGSIRQYIADSSSWYVHYFTSAAPTPVLPAWKGGMSGEDIVLYREQKAPNGAEGSYKIVFSKISDESFNWLGAWVDKEETFAYPTWKISCKKLK